MSLGEALNRFRQGPTDVVGIDIGSTAVKVARLRKADGNPQLVGAALLPGIEIPANALESPGQVPEISLPSALRGRYACLTTTGEDAVVKLLSFPGQFDERAEQRVVDNMGLDNPDDYRISYKLISEGHGRAESRVLTVALREEQAAAIPMLVRTGLPAPFSLEIAALAEMAAFLNAAGSAHAGSAVGVIDFGATVTTFALFNRNVLALLRRFNFGTEALLEEVQSTLGVDRETAQGIVTDGSFDISQSVNQIVEPLVKQLIVSRDFVERRENCRIEAIYATGGLALSHDSLNEIRSSMDLEVQNWNPFDGLAGVEAALPEELKGQEWRFAAAVGACLGTFEET